MTEKHQLGEIVVDGKVLLKCILKGYDLRTLTGLVWLEMK
jgi:hypothetical protein